MRPLKVSEALGAFICVACGSSREGLQRERGGGDGLGNYRLTGSNPAQHGPIYKFNSRNLSTLEPILPPSLDQVCLPPCRGGQSESKSCINFENCLIALILLLCFVSSSLYLVVLKSSIMTQEICRPLIAAGSSYISSLLHLSCGHVIQRMPIGILLSHFQI